MNNNILHVSLAFAYATETDLDVFAANHVICMTGNEFFMEPPVSMVAMGILQVNYHTALLASAIGGQTETALKSEARIPLVNALRLNAAYVQSRPGLTLSKLLSTGFVQTSNNHAQSQLATPTLMIENGNSTQLIANLSPVTNSASFLVRVLTPDGKVVATIISPHAGKIVIPNLTPGVVYTLQGQAVGGSTGFSDWSDPVSHMCM